MWKLRNRAIGNKASSQKRNCIYRYKLGICQHLVVAKLPWGEHGAWEEKTSGHCLLLDTSSLSQRALFICFKTNELRFPHAGPQQMRARHTLAVHLLSREFWALVERELAGPSSSTTSLLLTPLLPWGWKCQLWRNIPRFWPLTGSKLILPKVGTVWPHRGIQVGAPGCLVLTLL